MNDFAERISLPPTALIVQELGLEYTGQLEGAETDATFSYAVPVVTNDCPGTLQYFPLSKNSQDALSDNFNKVEFLQTIEGKKPCVIICSSYDKLGRDTERMSYNPYGTSPAYIAAFWDGTEDPLMAVTLYSCTLITKLATGVDSIVERVPLFLKKEEVGLWLSENEGFRAEVLAKM